MLFKEIEKCVSDLLFFHCQQVQLKKTVFLWNKGERQAKQNRSCVCFGVRDERDLVSLLSASFICLRAQHCRTQLA